MASCSEACVSVSVSGSGVESSGSEVGSSCLQFGVRSYLHHFYEDCTATASERDPESPGDIQTQRSPTHWWSSGHRKVSLALGLLILATGLICLTVGYSTTPRIESFGEGELLFIDTQAVSFNRGLHLSMVAGIGLSCLGTGLTMVSAWFYSRTISKERLYQKEGRIER